MTAALLVALLASAGDPSSALAAGPIGTGPTLGDLGIVRRAQVRSEVALALRPVLIYDEPGYYGMLDGAVELQGSWAAAERVELFAALVALQLRYVQNATLSATNVTLGSTSVGATWVPIALPDGRLDAGGYLRVTLPTSQEYRNAVPLGAQPGLTLQGRAGRSLGWYAGAAVPFSVTPSAGGTHPRVWLSAVAGGSWSPWSWMALVPEVNARFGPLDAVDAVAAALALRFASGRLGLELAGAVPFAGSSRYTAAALLRVAWRLDGPSP